MGYLVVSIRDGNIGSSAIASEVEALAAALGFVGGYVRITHESIGGPPRYFLDGRELHDQEYTQAADAFREAQV